MRLNAEVQLMKTGLGAAIPCGSIPLTFSLSPDQERLRQSSIGEVDDQGMRLRLEIRARLTP